MMTFTIRYDEELHRKLKVIAAYREESLNGLLMNMSRREIKEWEQEHGEIKFPSKPTKAVVKHSVE